MNAVLAELGKNLAARWLTTSSPRGCCSSRSPGRGGCWARRTGTTSAGSPAPSTSWPGIRRAGRPAVWCWRPLRDGDRLGRTRPPRPGARRGGGAALDGGLAPTGSAARRADDGASASGVAGGRGRLRAGGRASRGAGSPSTPARSANSPDSPRYATGSPWSSPPTPAGPAIASAPSTCASTRPTGSTSTRPGPGSGSSCPPTPAPNCAPRGRPTTPQSAPHRVGACRTCWSPSDGGRPP